MSNDDWQNPSSKRDHNRQPNQPKQEDRLPGPGESWTDSDAPAPLHQVSDNDWGTAPAPQSHHPPQYQQPQQQPQQPYQQQQQRPGNAQPNQGFQPGTRRRPGSAHPNQGYHQGGGPMIHQPRHGMQTTEMDGTDIGAIIISAIFPGVGHMMLGQVTKGIVILVATYLTCGLGYMLAALICVDAYMVAKARKVRPVDEWEFLPKP